MIRVVLDTNIIVSALLQPNGPPAQIFVLVLSNSLQLCVSGALFAEYEEVLRRPRLARDEKVIAGTLNGIREKGFWVRPVEKIEACSDPDDNMFLECAYAAEANFLITGNLKHFPPSWQGTRIVTPRWFIDQLSSGALGAQPYPTKTCFGMSDVLHLRSVCEVKRAGGENRGFSIARKTCRKRHLLCFELTVRFPGWHSSLVINE